MAAVPPCNSVLWLHILRSNMVASLWKRPTTASFTTPDITQHGRDLYINPLSWRCFSNRCGGYIVTWRIRKPWWIFKWKWWREWCWRWKWPLSSKILIHFKIFNETPFSCTLYNGAEYKRNIATFCYITTFKLIMLYFWIF